MHDSLASVPTVDISSINKGTAKALVQAGHELGLVYLEGSEFTKQQVDQAYELCKGYFDQPSQVKEQLPLDDTNTGYSSIYGEMLDSENKARGDPKEFYMQCQYANDQPTTRMADYLQARKPFVDRFVAMCNTTLKQVFQLLALGLEIPESEGGIDYFTNLHDPGCPNMSTLRLLHYPGQQSVSPEQQVRLGAHTDFGSVTLLFQKEGEEGLQVLESESQTWLPVPFRPSHKGPGAAPPLILNIADLMTFWTHGYMKSSLHRVVFPEKTQKSNKPRYSIVFFSHPDNNAPISSVPSPLIATDGAQTQEKAQNAESHLRNRLLNVRLKAA